MKVTIKTTEPQSMEIDWSKRMIVENIDGGWHVLTTGAHDGMCFTGLRIKDAFWLSAWDKSLFTPCTTPVTITFENEL